MNGPEHYREAERLLNDLPVIANTDAAKANRLARAQVHATLALAAATAGLDAYGDTGNHVGAYLGRSQSESEAWAAALEPLHPADQA